MINDNNNLINLTNSYYKIDNLLNKVKLIEKITRGLQR